MSNIKVLGNKAVNPAKSVPSSILEKQRLSHYFLSSSVIAQIHSVIQTAGVVISNTDVDATSVDPLLLAKAVSAYVHAGNFYQDIGTANAYILTPTKAFDLLDQNEKTYTGANKIHTQTPASLLDGMLVRFRPANANTTASTVEIKCNILTFNGTSGELEKVLVSLGQKSIKNLDGTADIAAGDLQTNTDIELRYSESLDCFILTGNSLASQPASNVNITGGNLDGANITDATIELGNDLDANSKKITNVANGTAGGDAINKSQLDLKADAAVVLLKANNLSDISNSSSARSNLGLGNVQNVDQTNASNITLGTLDKARLPILLNPFTVAKENSTNEGGQINFESPDGLGSGYIDVTKSTINNRYYHRFISNFNCGVSDAFGIEYNNNGSLRSVYTALPKSLAETGYTTLTDGIILQWGTVTVSGNFTGIVSTSITFPISFPNVATSFSGIVTTVGQVGACYLDCTALSSSSIGIRIIERSQSNAISSPTVKWMTIGY